jgi:DNA-binding MarR family transcriptional regulator
MQPTLPTHDATLARDAREMADALDGLARVYQLQDPRQVRSCGISLSECWALEACARRAPRTVGQIAEELMLDKSSASRAIAGLARKGLVRRRRSREDARSLEVRPTASGVRLLERIRESTIACTRAILTEFSPEHRRAAAEILRRATAAERACAAN